MISASGGDKIGRVQGSIEQGVDERDAYVINGSPLSPFLGSQQNPIAASTLKPETPGLRNSIATSLNAVTGRRSSGQSSLIRPLSTLAPFVPKLLQHCIMSDDARYNMFDSVESLEDLTSAATALKPSMIEIQAAIMVADIKGFTKLTEILSKRGSGGVELLTTCMNSYFARVISCIDTFDGDVIKFAGDSMIVAFYASSGPRAQSNETSSLNQHIKSRSLPEVDAAGTSSPEVLDREAALAAAVSRCVQCSHSLAQHLGHMRMRANGQVEAVKNVVVPESARRSADVSTVKTASTNKASESASEVLPLSALTTSNHIQIGSMSPLNSSFQLKPYSVERGEAASLTETLEPLAFEGVFNKQPLSSSATPSPIPLLADIKTHIFGRHSHTDKTAPLLPPELSQEQTSAAGSSFTTIGQPQVTDQSAGLTHTLVKAMKGIKMWPFSKSKEAVGITIDGVEASTHASSYTAAATAAATSSSADQSPAMSPRTYSVSMASRTSNGSLMGGRTTQLRSNHSGTLSSRMLHEEGGSSSSGNGAWGGGSDAIRQRGMVSFTVSSRRSSMFIEGGGYVPRGIAARRQSAFVPQLPPSQYSASAASRADSMMYKDMGFPSLGSPLDTVEDDGEGAAAENSEPSSKPSSPIRPPPESYSSRRSPESFSIFSRGVVSGGVGGGHQSTAAQASWQDRFQKMSEAMLSNTSTSTFSSSATKSIVAAGGTDIFRPERSRMSVSSLLSSPPQAQRTAVTPAHSYQLATAPSIADQGVSSPVSPGAASAATALASSPQAVVLAGTRRLLPQTSSPSSLRVGLLQKNSSLTRESAVPEGMEVSEDSVGMLPLTNNNYRYRKGSLDRSLYLAMDSGVENAGLPSNGDIVLEDSSEGEEVVSRSTGLMSGGVVVVDDITRPAHRRSEGMDPSVGVFGSVVPVSESGGFVSRVAAMFSKPSTTTSVKSATWHSTTTTLTSDSTYPLRASSPSLTAEELMISTTYTHLSTYTSIAQPSSTMGAVIQAGGRSPAAISSQPEFQLDSLTLSLKLMVGAGTVCVFHVGGCPDEDTKPELPSWSFFVGDRPFAPPVDNDGRRGCFVQLTSIEEYSMAGQVVLSPEACQVLGDQTWDVMMQADGRVALVVGPRMALPIPVPGHSGMRIFKSSLSSNAILPAHGDVRAAAAKAAFDDDHTAELAAVHDHTAELAAVHDPQDNRAAGIKETRFSIVPYNGPSSINAASSNAEGSNTEHSKGALGPSRSGKVLGNLNSSSPSKWGKLDGTTREELPEDTAVAPVATPVSLTASATSVIHRPPAGRPSSIPYLKAVPNLAAPGEEEDERILRRLLSTLRMMVPGCVRNMIEDGNLDFINEIRPLTCLYLGFPSLSQEEDPVISQPFSDRSRPEVLGHGDEVVVGGLQMMDSRTRRGSAALSAFETQQLISKQLGSVQFVVQQSQEVMRKWGGSCLQFRCDEKGYVCVCVFGLPGHTHENNPGKAVLSALELSQRIAEGGQRVCVGITTDNLLCTCVGARKARLEYTVYGDGINMSARYMMKLKDGLLTGDVLCDEATYHRCRNVAEFEKLPPVSVKGKQLPQTVYRVTPSVIHVNSPFATTVHRNHVLSRPMVGRDTEMGLIFSRAADLVSGAKSSAGAVIIEGNSGMGKTLLLDTVKRSLCEMAASTASLSSPPAETGGVSSREPFCVVYSTAEVAHKTDAFYPWRRIFAELFRVDMSHARKERMATVLNMKPPSSPRLSQLRPHSSQFTEDRIASGEAACHIPAATTYQEPLNINTGHLLTPLGMRLASVLPDYESQWRPLLAEVLALPLHSIPSGSHVSSGKPDLHSRSSSSKDLREHPPQDPNSPSCNYPAGGGILNVSPEGQKSWKSRSVALPKLVLPHFGNSGDVLGGHSFHQQDTASSYISIRPPEASFTAGNSGHSSTANNTQNMNNPFLGSGSHTSRRARRSSVMFLEAVLGAHQVVGGMGPAGSSPPSGGHNMSREASVQMLPSPHEPGVTDIHSGSMTLMRRLRRPSIGPWNLSPPHSQYLSPQESYHALPPLSPQGSLQAPHSPYVRGMLAGASPPSPSEGAMGGVPSSPSRGARVGDSLRLSSVLLDALKVNHNTNRALTSSAAQGGEQKDTSVRRQTAELVTAVSGRLPSFAATKADRLAPAYSGDSISFRCPCNPESAANPYMLQFRANYSHDFQAPRGGNRSSREIHSAGSHNGGDEDSTLALAGMLGVNVGDTSQDYAERRSSIETTAAAVGMVSSAVYSPAAAARTGVHSGGSQLQGPQSSPSGRLSEATLESIPSPSHKSNKETGEFQVHRPMQQHELLAMDTPFDSRVGSFASFVVHSSGRTSRSDMRGSGSGRGSSVALNPATAAAAAPPSQLTSMTAVPSSILRLTTPRHRLTRAGSAYASEGSNVQDDDSSVTLSVGPNFTLPHSLSLNQVSFQSHPQVHRQVSTRSRLSNCGTAEAAAAAADTLSPALGANSSSKSGGQSRNISSRLLSTLGFEDKVQRDTPRLDRTGSSSHFRISANTSLPDNIVTKMGSFRSSSRQSNLMEGVAKAASAAVTSLASQGVTYLKTGSGHKFSGTAPSSGDVLGRGSHQEGLLLQTPNSSASITKLPTMRTSFAAETSLLTMALAADVSGQQQQLLSMAAGHSAMLAPPGVAGSSSLLKDIQRCLLHVLWQYIAQYGPVVILLDNLHDFDSWSWQLLIKAVDVALVIAARRPGSKRQEVEKRQALAQHMADTAIGQLLRLDSTLHIRLQPFSLEQTRQLMQAVSKIEYPSSFVQAVLDKTAGMPLYIEKMVEFLDQQETLLQSTAMSKSGGQQHVVNIDLMINNISLQEVILQRMDRLPPRIQLCLKVASIMGQTVDIDVLQGFHPIKMTREELLGHLVELERANLLHAGASEGTWEFNMVERDIVYEVLPHYQRRRLHAHLAQGLERELPLDFNVGALTSIAYHWSQAFGSLEVPCGLKAVEFWLRAAELAYDASSLSEALRLFQQASEIADVLSAMPEVRNRASVESEGAARTTGQQTLRVPSATSAGSRPSSRPSSKTAVVDKHDPLVGTKSEGNELTLGKQSRRSEGHRRSSESVVEILEEEEEEEEGEAFTALGLKHAQRTDLKWSLISRTSRVQMERSMALCCLGIMLQHQLGEFDSQLQDDEGWDESDYFSLLTECAMRGLEMLGCPEPERLIHLLHTHTNDASAKGATSEASNKSRNGGQSGIKWLFCCGGGSTDAIEDKHERSKQGATTGHQVPMQCSSTLRHSSQSALEQLLHEAEEQLHELLTPDDMEEVRSLLLVLVIAAENYCVDHSSTFQYMEIIAFCAGACRYFSQRCKEDPASPTALPEGPSGDNATSLPQEGLDVAREPRQSGEEGPFSDIAMTCLSRLAECELTY
ncbi:hypothetical protein CEUSTIGMA_g5691.t1 [Chlamydomonas eustigma]|uniref:Guanylate cyclase domain-containing protein n=1 Tax=Chlamydomonas eustigma TaxID=1157962 RepID=A0A250X5Q8_9CHLO|nr:hypothetical protein CEUSTIGMA_g5691.t1 [Chlamydomonas eustigma]|eukprot:GAX78249.1 hypothetical protein CEUSTIGMA_g5691.t1 [Chlamydomonas eustigma]